jgi:hypothetical protein
MIPDSDFIRVSFFLAQRPTKADSSAPLRCHSTWRNAPPRPLAEVLAKSIIKSLKTNQVLVS